MAVKKLYTESYIADIADSIRHKNGTSNTYKISEMSAAIDGLADKWTAAKKWFARCNESREGLASGIAYYPDANTYGLIPTYTQIRLGAEFGADQTKGFYPRYLSINSDQAGTNGMVGNLSDWGDDVLENYVPFWLTDFTFGGFKGYQQHILIDDLEFLESGYIQASEISQEDSLPTLYNALSGERSVSVNAFKNAIKSIKYKEIIADDAYDTLPFDIDTITGFIYYSTGEVLILSSTISGATVGTYDTSNNLYSGGTGQYNILGSDSSGINGIITNTTRKVYKASWTNWGVVGEYKKGTKTLEQLSSQVLLHTDDIKDQNGNVILPANCQVSDFF